MKVFILIGVLVLTSACNKNNPLTALNPELAKDSTLLESKRMSASDIRRSLASSSASKKDEGFYPFASDRDEDSPPVFRYNCDREELPRTCCYYVLDNRNAVNSMSCVEENH